MSMPGKIRPSVSISYSAALDGDHVLVYSNLQCRYHEEEVIEGARGYAVVGHSYERQFLLSGRFAVLDLLVIPVVKKKPLGISSWNEYHLEVVFDETVMARVAQYRALPYGKNPVEKAIADEQRSDGTLTCHVARHILNRFEQNFITAVLGDGWEKLEFSEVNKRMLTEIHEKWHAPLSIISKKSAAGVGVVLSDYCQSRTLSSPFVDKALQAIVLTAIHYPLSELSP